MLVIYADIFPMLFAIYNVVSLLPFEKKYCVTGKECCNLFLGVFA